MKLLIITGGSKGLGRAIINTYKSDQWKIYDLSRTGESENHIKLDLSIPEDVPQALDKIFKDILSLKIEEVVYINNASIITPIVSTRKLMDKDIIQSINVNLISSFILVRSILDKFRDCKVPKTLMNISSGAANKGYPGWSLYCLSKAGIENLFKTIYEEEKNELSPYRILNFDPYVMDTSMQEEIRSSKVEDFPDLERFKSFKDESKLMTPIKVAEIIKLLISNKDLNDIRYGAVELSK
jgi:benzil reductase ((S)-benzoin forming)